tara:strand:+ start:303 stop:755 length:453 start_codon:yes stop_codon:yes gene_type:complete
MIKQIHNWEKAVVTLLNLDGWDLKHSGEGSESWDAIGKTPKGQDCVIEMKFRNKYYDTKIIEKFKYDKLIGTNKVALYLVNDPKGNYMFWLNNLKELETKNMYCPDTTLWTKKKVSKPCYLLKESDAAIININEKDTELGIWDSYFKVKE